MKELIRKILLEKLQKPNLSIKDINDIEDDTLYDNLISQAEELKNLQEISFNGDLMFVIYDTNTNELAAASWLESNTGVFSPHFIVKPSYRGLKLYPELFNANVNKYKKMKEVRTNYNFLLNAVNNDLGSVATKYGFEPYKNLDNYYVYVD